MNSAFVGYEELSRSRRDPARPSALVDNTPSSICLILHILRKPNSLIANYWIYYVDKNKKNFFFATKKIQDGKLLRSLTYCCATTSQT